MPGWLRAFIRFILSIWFRSVEVLGVSQSPRAGPLIVVANHENGLVDPMLIAAYLPVAPRFLGKSTLWKIPILWPFLWSARVVPVYRRKDVNEGVDPSKNDEMFAVSGKVLQEGGVIALFPEGESHNAPGMLPLKTGAARICLSGPPSTLILPVGMAFHDKHRFRGRALLVVGEVIDPGPLRAASGGDPRAVAHAITDQIAQALKKVTINVPTWDDRKLLERAVEISRSDGESLAARTRHLQNFTEAWSALSASNPAEVAALRTQVSRYDSELRMLRMTDEEVKAEYRPVSVMHWLVRFARLFLLKLPLGVVGFILHAAPYQLPRLVARPYADEPDQPASYKIMASMVIYPAWWALLVGVAWWLAGTDLALMTIVVAPLSGWYALAWMESGFTLADQARSWLLRGRRKSLIEGLRAQRAAIAADIAELERVWRGSVQGASGSKA